MLPRMTLALLVLVAVAYYLYKKRKKKGVAADVERDSSPALDGWIAEALERELAEGALGLRGSTPEERRKLAASLRGEPDPDVVSKIEDKVKLVELEYMKYPHEADAEVTLRVRYVDGTAGTASKRLAWKDVPGSITADFESRKTSRIFRTWVFPWSRAHAL
ncbi:MAG: hypothetical protein JWP97_5183 [Labilithrix sp.]|nr:hypothetical protein [Labilithrix sp.]